MIEDNGNHPAIIFSELVHNIHVNNLPILNMDNYDKAYNDLAGTIANAIRYCKEEFGRVDYETCIDLWEQSYVDELFDKHASVVYFIGRKAAGYTYEGASIKIDGHRIFLEKVYNEVMRDIHGL